MMGRKNRVCSPKNACDAARVSAKKREAKKTISTINTEFMTLAPAWNSFGETFTEGHINLPAGIIGKDFEPETLDFVEMAVVARDQRETQG